MISIPEKKPYLILETGLKGSTGITLQFNYEGNKIYSNDPSNSFTRFEKKGEKFIFKKYHRDFDWEKQCRKTLGELGFFSDDDINFFPGFNKHKRKNELYSILEIVNSNYAEIIDSGFILTFKT